MVDLALKNSTYLLLLSERLFLWLCSIHYDVSNGLKTAFDVWLCSESLKDDLDHFIKEHFPSNLVKLVRIPERVGLIRARLEGFRHVTAEVVAFFDSHMEVNIDWYDQLLIFILSFVYYPCLMFID